MKSHVVNIFSQWEETFNEQIIRTKRNPLASRKVLLARLDEKEITKKIFENLNSKLSEEEKNNFNSLINKTLPRKFFFAAHARKAKRSKSKKVPEEFQKVTGVTNYGEFIRDIDLMIYEELFFLINKIGFKKAGAKTAAIGFVRNKLIPIKNRNIVVGIKIGANQLHQFTSNGMSANELKLVLPTLLSNEKALIVYKKIFEAVVTEFRKVLKETIEEMASRVN